ncbi:MAG TPA: IS630 family transposase [Actinomycetes bacterium]|jgi:transposase|nr:IS630 family transposase [Actinomycetes bacterium]
MPNRVRVLTVPEADRAELERRVRDRGAPARVSERAKIVLLSADGLTGPQIAERAGCTEPTVVKWRRQYAEAGLAGLEDAPRPGGPKTVLTGEAVCEILSATVTPPPESLRAAGVTHWSSRRLADWLRRTKKITVSHDSISRLWRKFCLQPHRTEGFKFSTDPRLEAKVRDVVGLYLHPPQNAVVVCVDEKSQCQALERSQPILPMRQGIPQRQTHDYARHGVTSLFAALNTATGQVTDACYPRHRHQEFLKFLKKVAAAYPGTELHVVCDNYSTHKHPEVRRWLARPENQRITLHFTPTGCSWINLVECFFSIITRQAIRRGSFTSVRQLTQTIGAFIDSWNDHPRPFTWTKDADEILSKINRAKAKVNALTDH